MVQEETNLIVADNSGARKVRCIRVLGGHGKKYASLGDIIVVTVKAAIPNSEVKKEERTSKIDCISLRVWEAVTDQQN